MKWYTNRKTELQKAAPILSACGDDCAVCPRYIARTEEELRETAELWYRLGWRDRVVANDEISCTGCGCRPGCAFGILPCRRAKGVASCRDCGEPRCGLLEDMPGKAAATQERLRAVCGDGELFGLLRRAFCEKEKNLGIGETDEPGEDIHTHQR